MEYSPRSMRARMSWQSATCTRVSTRYLSSKRPAIALPRDPGADVAGEPRALGAVVDAGGEVEGDHARGPRAHLRRRGSRRVAGQLVQAPAVVGQRGDGVAPGEAELVEDRDGHLQRRGRALRVLVEGEDQLGAARGRAHPELAVGQAALDQGGAVVARAR